MWLLVKPDVIDELPPCKTMTIGDETFVHWTSTLPTGHRATSYINTVLNRAYLLPFLG